MITSLLTQMLIGFSVTVAWDAPSNHVSVPISGYKIYVGQTPRTYGAPIVLTGTNTTYTITNLQSRVPYYITVTAYTTSGLESDFSNELNYNLPPQQLKITPEPTQASLTKTNATTTVSIEKDELKVVSKQGLKLVESVK